MIKRFSIDKDGAYLDKEGGWVYYDRHLVVTESLEHRIYILEKCLASIRRTNRHTKCCATCKYPCLSNKDGMICDEWTDLKKEETEEISGKSEN